MQPVKLPANPLELCMQNLPKAVLFDLDGTLVDTAPDLAYALNQTLQHYGERALPYAQIRPLVSHGGVALIKAGFRMQPDDVGFEERRQYLLEVYRQDLCRKTALFDGIQAVLQYLENQHIAWGIVTNKPTWLTNPLMTAMGIDQRTQAIVSGDTCAHCKPHPEPIQYACRLLQVEPQQTWFVGDAGRDMQAGRAAGCNATIGAAYGYIYPDDPIAEWDTDHVIETPNELIQLIDGHQ